MPLVISAVTPSVVGLPARQQDVLLIVSRMVAAALPQRRDLVFPYDVMRDSEGHPIGCRALGQVPPARNQDD